MSVKNIQKCYKQLFAYRSKERRLKVVYVPQLHERLEITKKMQNVSLLGEAYHYQIKR